MSDKNLKPKEEELKNRKGYNPEGKELKVWQEYRRRKKELLDSRKNIHNLNIDEMTRRFDKDYFNREANIPASELDPDQKPLSINNAFGKVQSALGILIDRNPKIVLDESNSKYSANRDLIRGLAEKSWKNTNSLGQFKLSVFNAAKRGWFAGRTFNRQLIHPARFAQGLDEKGNVAYTESMITKLDDVAYINLDNHNVWIDEEARPEDMFSARDGMHREVWHIDKIRNVFSEKEFPNMKFVVSGGNTQEHVEGVSSSTNTSSYQAQQRELKKGMTELFFYEHQYNDWFIVEINEVMVVWEPLPQDHKRLSYTWGYWNLRSAETIYGIGIIEEMERNETLIDRIINMTMRQLLLSINPGGFYSGTEDLENENIRIKPGVLRKTLNPKDIAWLQVPKPDKSNLDYVSWLEQKEEQSTGITKLIEGEAQIGKSDTAFEIGVNREASLKRLKIPLKSFQYALDWEFKNRIDLIKQTYSDFQVQHLTSEEEIQNYLDEVGADPDFYFIENEGQRGQEKFFVKKFREVNLNLEQDSKGNFIESEKKSFFKIKPEYLSWEGDVSVNMDSILVQSEELEKADTLRLSNLIIPLLVQDPAVVLNPVKQLLIAFNKDPRKWLPKTWIDLMSGKAPEQPNPTAGTMPNNPPGEMPMKPNTVVPPSELKSNPNMIQRFSSALRAFKKPNAGA